MKTIDIIVPCYNEEEVLPLFVKETNAVIDTIPEYRFRYIFVNDGSKDKTLEVLKTLASRFLNVKYISFSRNFGKESAMYAGLKNSTADYVIVMDADLQHPPAMFPQMIQGLSKRETTAVHFIVRSRQVKANSDSLCLRCSSLSRTTSPTLKCLMVRLTTVL